MSYLETIRALADDPEQLEQAYHAAEAAGEAETFAEALHQAHAERSGNLLYAAWHVRLRHATAAATRRAIAWGWAVPLAALTGAGLWLLSDDGLVELHLRNPLTDTGTIPDTQPFVLLAAPLAALAILAFLAGAGDRRWRRAAALGLALAGLAAYPLALHPQTGTVLYQEQYLALSVLSLGLLGWSAVGLYTLHGQGDPANRFAFLLKSLEYAVVAGLCGIILGLFVGLTIGLFNALDLFPPPWLQRLFFAGGAGAVAVLAAALTVAPGVAPKGQPTNEGPGRLVTLFLRLLLPLAILVLAVFLGFIPANARVPFENREVLVAFNAMLFAVVGLLVGVTPLREAELGPRTRTWLRRGVISLAGLAFLVGLYALAAILYRAIDDRLTPNRMVFIGWNVLNLGLLAWLLWRQHRAGEGGWLPALRRALGEAMIPYATWAAVTLLATPWLFGIEQLEVPVSELPSQVQELIGDGPAPILLKCRSEPEIYLLERGKKRWIEDIEVFNAEGYQWRDVSFVSCADLARVPDGTPIPPDAGWPDP